MNNVLRKISWLVLVAVVIITAIGYICPMSMNGESSALSYMPSLCQSVGSASSGMDGMTSCMEIHLTAMGRFLGDVPNVVSSLLVLAFIIVTASLFSRNFLIAITAPLLSRLRYRYFCYQTSIKLLVEKNILKYLSLLGNYTIVSSF